MAGALEEHPPVQILARLASARATGLLVAEVEDARKDVYFVDGKPEYVVSNLQRELLGEYLVSQKILSEGELAMALAMIGSFQGRLGDTLVGLGLMKPLDVFRYLLRQVREKIVELCTWPTGSFRFYNGKKTTRAYFRLGLDPFELLGLGARALPPELVAAWARPHFTARLAPVVPPRIAPESFKLGTAPRDLYDRLDGQATLGDLAGRYDVEGRMEFLRLVYLLYQSEVVTLD
jgi:serine/threonine-protein kinase